jgi:hypothetical protein
MTYLLDIEPLRSYFIKLVVLGFIPQVRFSIRITWKYYAFFSPLLILILKAPRIFPILVGHF